MRDIVILALLVITTVWALRQPWIGIITWTVVSLMSPHMEFGYHAADWPVATGVALCTLGGMLATTDRQNPLIAGGPRWLLLFVIWICITLPFSAHFEWAEVRWERSIKIYLMIFVTLALLTDRRKLQAFIWANAISVGYYGVKGGVFTILTGGNYRVWGPGGFIEGNNEVALAVICTIPLIRYLQMQLTDRRARLAMAGAMFLCVATALGTYSRGALIGLGAMGAMFWWKGDRKIIWGIAIAAIGSLTLSLMPAQWWDRMDTIKTYDADASAMGRINAWWMAYNLAKDRFFGGGFEVATPQMFAKYAPVPSDLHAAHSIYFQIMGEHGFLGLALFLSIGAVTWMTCRKLRRIARKDPTLQWAGDLGAMVQVSMVGYATAGAFLSLAYYDLPYNMMVMVAVALLLVHREQASRITPVPMPGATAVRLPGRLRPLHGP